MWQRKWQFYKTFSRKVLKEYTFSWKFKLVFLVVIPLGLVSFNLRLFHNKSQTPEIIYDKIDQDALISYFPGNINDKLLYFPDNNFTQNLMEEVRFRMLILHERVKGFKDEKDLKVAIDSTTNKNLFAVIFHKSPNGLENDLKYTIRNRNSNLKTDLVFRTNFNELNSRELDEYMISGFLALQATINNVYMEQQNITSLPIMFEHFPAKPSEIVENPNIPSFAVLLIIIICMAVFNTILIPMVDDEENGIRDLLKITTRYFYLYEIARLVIVLVFLILFITIVFGLTRFHQMWGQVNLFFPFLLTFLFVMSLFSYTMCLSLLFKTVEYCKIAGVLFYFVPFFVFNLLNERWFISSLKYCSPSNTFYEGMKLINVHVLTERNIDFSSGNQIPQQHLDDTTQLNLFTLYGFLLLHTVLYLLGYYLINYIKNKDTARKTFNIFSGNKTVNQTKNLVEESELVSKNTVISLQCISKTFKDWKKITEALKDVSLNIENNEIKVLLGHNGAGKTTLMSIIAGVLKASSGNILVSNQAADGEQYEEMIGYCPQRNVFMKELNCYEHVKFFGELRGLSPSESARESERVLNDGKLWSHKNKYPIELSGGMKRRLCLAMSVIGNTKVVIMDEASSGLDPKTRKELWKILKKLKADRAIITSTHFIERADLLADKVVILKEGQIDCEGTPMELKKQNTSGYILKIVTNPLFVQIETEEILRAEVPKFKLRSHEKLMICYNIPFEYKEKYKTILQRLENDKNKLNIEYLSITNPPLEDVFLKCSSKQDDPGINHTADLDELLPRFLMLYPQICGVLYKKAVHLKNEWKYFLFLASLPFFALVFSVFLIKASLTEVEQNSLNLDFNAHPMNHTIVVSFNGMENSDYQQGILMESFRSTAPNINFQFLFDTNLEKYLLAANGQDIHNYNEKIVSGIEMNLDRLAAHVLVFHSGNYYHGSVKSFNLISNVILKYSENHQDSFINTLNRPLLRETDDMNRNHVYIYENLMPLGIFFFLIFFAMESYNDNITQFQSLFPITPFKYWTITYIFDLIVHLLVIMLLTGVSIAFSFYVEIFPKETHVLMGLIFFMYAVPLIPLMYLLTKYIKSPDHLYSIMSYMAVIGVVLSQVLISSPDKIREYDVENSALIVLPDFAIRQAIRFSIFRTVMDSYDDAYSLSSYVMIMIIEGIIIIMILIFLPRSRFLVRYIKIIKIMIRSKLQSCMGYSRSVDDIDLGNFKNTDVEDEREATRTLMRSESRHSTQDLEYPIIVYDLTKKYDNKLVVNNLCFRVKKGECFGLLGVNGAGKSSALQMMALNKSITSGAVLLNGIDRKSNNKNEYRANFGYCPQIDALNTSMTAYETLKYMSLIRELTNVNSEVEKWLKNCDLWEYRNIPVSNYSGGTKRKLSIAIALLGSPPVIILDEPTTGVDPRSRRKIWQCIEELKKEGTTIMLTSHSLDECEQLCSRIGIMYKGKLHCLGVTQKLKKEYADEYILIMETTESLNNQRISEINSQLRELKFDSNGPRKEGLQEELKSLQNVEIENLEREMRNLGLEWKPKEQHQRKILKYRINKKGILWSKVLDVLSVLKEKFPLIKDYSVNEVSLEDMFIQIANNAEHENILPRYT